MKKVRWYTHTDNVCWSNTRSKFDLVQMDRFVFSTQTLKENIFGITIIDNGFFLGLSLPIIDSTLETLGSSLLDLFNTAAILAGSIYNHQSICLPWSTLIHRYVFIIIFFLFYPNTNCEQSQNIYAYRYWLFFWSKTSRVDIEYLFFFYLYNCML